MTAIEEIAARFEELGLDTDIDAAGACRVNGMVLRQNYDGKLITLNAKGAAFYITSLSVSQIRGTLCLTLFQYDRAIGSLHLSKIYKGDDE